MLLNHAKIRGNLSVSDFLDLAWECLAGRFSADIMQKYMVSYWCGIFLDLLCECPTWELLSLNDARIRGILLVCLFEHILGVSW